MTGTALVIRGGRVVDPAQGIDRIADVVVRDGLIHEIVPPGEAADIAAMDASGHVVAPGFVDLHVHLRVPGFEAKETLATGSAAAAAGGFTTICCMPNTRPALDSSDVVIDLMQRIAAEATVRVLPIATISKGRLGTEPVDYEALAADGAIGFSDDGDSTRDSAVMRRALEASRVLGLPIMVHCEDQGLVGGAMHEGDVSRRLGVPGIPAEAEEIILERDLLLARLTGGWLHALHVSTGRGIESVRRAKADGLRVTAEVMPHHLLMSDEWVAGARTLLNVEEPSGTPGAAADPNTKVNPPLRPVADTLALLNALKAGDFDVIATDHAPHAEPEKAASSFTKAAFGMSGLEFALPLCLALVRAGHLTLPEMVHYLATAPGRLIRRGGTLEPGAPADIVVFDPTAEWVVTPETLQTKSKNTPLLGMTLRGKPTATFVGGEQRYGA